MGTEGVPFNIPAERILESIKKKKGIVTQICKDLDICYQTYYNHIKPKFKEQIDRARNDYDETICDMAETALMRALNQTESISASLDSAKFVLNNKGASRGYRHPSAKPIEEGDINETRRAVQDLKADAGNSGSGQSQLENEPSVLHQGCARKQGPVQAKLGTDDPLAGFPPV